jgi:hypothetical protein
MRTLRFRLAALGTSTLLAGALWAVPASAKSGDTVRRGSCTARSNWKLKLGPRGSTIETEFQVDSNRVGQKWNVKITDQGATVLRRTARTIAPSGSFTVRTRPANRAGVDTFVATATNARTGERCVGRAAV